MVPGCLGRAPSLPEATGSVQEPKFPRGDVEPCHTDSGLLEGETGHTTKEPRPTVGHGQPPIPGNASPSLEQERNRITLRPDLRNAPTTRPETAAAPAGGTECPDRMPTAPDLSPTEDRHHVSIAEGVPESQPPREPANRPRHSADGRLSRHGESSRSVGPPKNLQVSLHVSSPSMYAFLRKQWQLERRSLRC
jgi:hypothetical protein